MILEDLKVILEQSAYKLKHVEDILEHHNFIRTNKFLLSD